MAVWEVACSVRRHHTCPREAVPSAGPWRWPASSWDRLPGIVPREHSQAGAGNTAVLTFPIPLPVSGDPSAPPGAALLCQCVCMCVCARAHACT